MGSSAYMVGAFTGRFDLLEGISVPLRGSARVEARTFTEPIDSVAPFSMNPIEEFVTKPAELHVEIDLPSYQIPAESKPFRWAIADDPGCSIARLVFADWLEERGFQRESAFWCYPFPQPGVLTLDFITNGTGSKLTTTQVVNVLGRTNAFFGNDEAELGEAAIRRKLYFTDSLEVILSLLISPFSQRNRPKAKTAELGSLATSIAPAWFADFQTAVLNRTSLFQLA